MSRTAIPSSSVTSRVSLSLAQDVGSASPLMPRCCGPGITTMELHLCQRTRLGAKRAAGRALSISYRRPMSEAPERTDGLNLKEVAAALGVHYMTAYRYVRTGRLDAEKVGTAWVVRPEALGRFTDGPA